MHERAVFLERRHIRLEARRPRIVDERGGRVLHRLQAQTDFLAHRRIPDGTRQACIGREVECLCLLSQPLVRKWLREREVIEPFDECIEQFVAAVAAIVVGKLQERSRALVIRFFEQLLDNVLPQERKLLLAAETELRVEVDGLEMALQHAHAELVHRRDRRA